MRAHGNEGRLGRRFAIVIGVAAAGVMALGAQTATSTTGPVDRAPPDLRLSGAKKQKTIHPRSSEAQVFMCELRWASATCTCHGALSRPGVHHTRHGEADEGQEGQARAGRGTGTGATWHPG